MKSRPASIATRALMGCRQVLVIMYKLADKQDQEQTCKAKVSVARRPTVSQTTAGNSAAPSLVEGAGNSTNASAVFPPYFTTILPFAGKGLLTSGSTACTPYKLATIRGDSV